jgi:hypothetical protein
MEQWDDSKVCFDDWDGTYLVALEEGYVSSCCFGLIVDEVWKPDHMDPDVLSLEAGKCELCDADVTYNPAFIEWCEFEKTIIAALRIKPKREEE